MADATAENLLEELEGIAANSNLRDHEIEAAAKSIYLQLQRMSTDDKHRALIR